jgi:hypothetical protein
MLFALFLLAQSVVPQVGEIERLVDKYGFSGCVVIGVMYLLWTKGGKFMEAQARQADAAAEHLRSDAASKPVMAQALHSIARNAETVKTTNRALERFADMAESAAEHASPDIYAKVRPHVEAIREILCTEGKD